MNRDATISAIISAINKLTDQQDLLDILALAQRFFAANHAVQLKTDYRTRQAS